MPKKIYLSPSMQKNNIYAYGGTNEMEQCYIISEYCSTYLKKHGFDVKIAPKGQSMNTNIQESNSWNPDLHISIHTNALDGSANGTIVMIYSKDKNNIEPAQCIYKRVFDVTPGTTRRDIQERPDLAELRETKSIAIYVECEFHDNLAISKWIIENTKILGESIAEGVCDYYGINTNQNENSINDSLFKVQVGAYKNRKNAEKMAEKLKSLGIIDVYINK